MIITTKFRGEIGGMTATSCMPVSFKPAMIAVAISRSNRTHYLTQRSEYFAVNWLDRAYSKQILAMATTKPGIRNKLRDAELSSSVGKSKTPALREAVAVVECKVWQVFRMGDHDLFLGRVLSASATADFDEYWRFSSYSPALYVGSWAEESERFRGLVEAKRDYTA